MKFQEQAKVHLAQYKDKVLGIQESGFWKRNNRPYSHILPEHSRELNLLSPYRTELTQYIQQENIHLHQNFHHLNSSQAMCLNFFYPLLFENQMQILLETFGIENEFVLEGTFEKVISKQEGTNFDFYIRTRSNVQLFFEIKLTEDGFGKVSDHPKYRAKFERIYKERLAGMLRDDVSATFEALIKNYQLLRNISYVDASRDDLLIIICPEKNLNLHKEFKFVANQVIEQELLSKIRLLSWGTLVQELLRKLESSVSISPRLVAHYKEFEAKYLI